MILKNDKLLVRKLKESDKYILVKWLSNPTVLQFYEGRDKAHDFEMVTEHFYNRTDERVTACIVEYDGMRIGYIQFYLIDDAERKEYGYGLTESIYGTDQFIGEPEYWNKGIGKKLVNSMVEFLTKTKGADRIVMDPHVSNERALSCYEKCGFNRVKLLPRHEYHEGLMRDSWLVEYKYNNIE